MSEKRTRYTINGNFKINDKDLKGQIVVDMGPCTFSGKTPTKSRPILAGDLTSRKFKFLDPKVAIELGSPKNFATFTLSENHIATFLTKLDKG